MNNLHDRALEWVQCAAAINTARPDENNGVVDYLVTLIQEDEKRQRMAAGVKTGRVVPAVERGWQE
ncbi:hypothetical protein NF212_16120 [Parasalinivibrio latis]|uniref:hypothetical protein n=1 Tax=Parasalinivibrio latis TaxID=2952610 RepID=UPI0030E04B34